MCARAAAVSVVIAGLVVAIAAPVAAAGRRPDFQMPFGCDQAWKATTYSGHKGIDWNWGVGSDDLGKPVVASAGGLATSRYNSGYGYYVDVDHGGGWVTRYAHLLAGGRATGFVGTGERIGLVGGTGRSTAPHLHWEQIADGTSQATLHVRGEALRPDGRSYVSRNCFAARPFDSDDTHADGIEDLLARFARPAGASRIRLLRGAGRRELRASRALDTTAAQLPPRAMLALGDANGTGGADLNAAFADGSGVRVVTYPATADGPFGDRRTRHGASRWRFRLLRGLHAGDVDGDGIDDLVVPFVRSGGAAVVRLLPGRRRRVLAAKVALRADAATLPRAAMLAVGDTDGDGRADLNAAIPTTVGVRIVTFRGRRDRTFGSRRTRFATRRWDPRGLRSLHAGDVDGDGVDDLLVRQVAPRGRSTLWVVQGAGQRSLQATVGRHPTRAALPATARLTIGDTDANGRADLNATYGRDGGTRFVTFSGQASGALGGPKLRYFNGWAFSSMR